VCDINMNVRNIMFNTRLNYKDRSI